MLYPWFVCPSCSPSYILLLAPVAAVVFKSTTGSVPADRYMHIFDKAMWVTSKAISPTLKRNSTEMVVDPRSVLAIFVVEESIDDDARRQIQTEVGSYCLP